MARKTDWRARGYTPYRFRVGDEVLYGGTRYLVRRRTRWTGFRGLEMPRNEYGLYTFDTPPRTRCLWVAEDQLVPTRGV